MIWCFQNEKEDVHSNNTVSVYTAEIWEWTSVEEARRKSNIPVHDWNKERVFWLDQTHVINFPTEKVYFLSLTSA